MTKKVKREDWRFWDKVKQIIDKNCKEEPYEGTEVNKNGIVEELKELLTSKEYSLLHHKKN